jgi:hypothetical protein
MRLLLRILNKQSFIVKNVYACKYGIQPLASWKIKDPSLLKIAPQNYNPTRIFSLFDGPLLTDKKLSKKYFSRF